MGKYIYRQLCTEWPSSLLILAQSLSAILSTLPNFLSLEDLYLLLQTVNVLCVVQLRVNQDEPMEDYPVKAEGGKEDDSSSGTRRFGMGQTTKDQMRTNVINEILSTERDYIKHLKDICEVTE